jgi:hypothetical protein
MTMTRRPDAHDFSGRDLRFHPVDPTGAGTLRPDQVARYNEQGFVSELDVFDAAEAASLRSYIDGLLESVLAAADNRNSYSINSYHPVCAGLWDVVTEPRITALVRDLLGDDAVCWGTHLFAKLPGDGKEVPFHQDAVYWPFTPTKTTSVWLAIDDVDAGNAAVQFVPGSHLDGPIVHEVLDLDGSRVLGRRATGMDERPARFVNELRSGQVSLHSDLLLHGSEANTSTRRRAGLTLRYAAAEVRLMDGFDEWGRSAVHVLDGDPSGFWGNRPRPVGERPDLMAELWGDFDGQAVDAG